MKNYDLSITIPFYNEEKTVGILTNILIDKFKKNHINYELILVNNGSNDKTPKIIDDLARKYSEVKAVHIKINQGYGFGILQGLKVSKGDYIGFIDGDLEVLPFDVIKVYNKIRKDDADICKGIKNIRGSTGLRNLFSYFYDIIFCLFYFKYIKQINAKPKIMRKKCFNKMKLESKDWFIDTEILIKSIRNNYFITTQQTIYSFKKGGKSHVKLFTILEFLKNLIKYRFSS